MDLELNCNDDNYCAGGQYYEQEVDYDSRDYLDYMENDEDEPRDTLQDAFYLCTLPSIQGVFEYAFPLLLLTAFLRFGFYFVRSDTLLHVASSLGGLYILQHYAPECIYILPAYILFSYVFLVALGTRSIGLLVFLPSLMFVLLCEYSMQPSSWNKVRGFVMIAVMKVVSVSVEWTGTLDPLAYGGYILCPVTCLFGPWISFKDYVALQDTSQRRIVLSILESAGFLVFALCFLCASNCFVPLIPNEPAWLGAYRDALAFRTSHYFVSSMATATMLLGGFTREVSKVTRPLEMELPRSLVDVVVSWNIPMHQWLKMYIFRPGRKQLGRFGGVLATYLASSLLHGLNFQLASVLLSLGFYTYVEFQLRFILSDVLDACVGAKSCGTKCTHSRKSHCWWVVAVNLAFSGLAVFHLAYLGLMFDTSELQETGYSYEHTLAKWSQFHFASHWVVVATYVAYFLIR